MYKLEHKEKLKKNAMLSPHALLARKIGFNEEVVYWLHLWSSDDPNYGDMFIDYWTTKPVLHLSSLSSEDLLNDLVWDNIHTDYLMKGGPEGY